MQATLPASLADSSYWVAHWPSLCNLAHAALGVCGSRCAHRNQLSALPLTVSHDTPFESVGLSCRRLCFVAVHSLALGRVRTALGFIAGSVPSLRDHIRSSVHRCRAVVISCRVLARSTSGWNKLYSRSAVCSVWIGSILGWQNSILSHIYTVSLCILVTSYCRRYRQLSDSNWRATGHGLAYRTIESVLLPRVSLLRLITSSHNFCLNPSEDNNEV